MKRLCNIDYLRGLAALCIMVYHYLSWTLGLFNSDSIMGRIGIYGVSIFYILSGLTLHHVYFKKMTPSRRDVPDFFKKRFFRIFPLLWLVILATLILQKRFPDTPTLFLNVTGLFGLFQWDQYIGTGLWSIGNELVFYLFFPIFVWLAKKSMTAFTLLCMMLLGVYSHFAFNILTPDIPLAQQWKNYVNPLNQVFLFLGGFLIGLIFEKTKVAGVVNGLILFVGIGIFVAYPVEGNDVHLVTGVNRLVFTAASFLICFSFYKSSVQLPRSAGKPLALLGEASYSVYMLHPVIYSLVGLAQRHLFHFPESIKLIIAFVITILTSHFVYTYFEKYFMRIGRRKSISFVGQGLPGN